MICWKVFSDNCHRRVSSSLQEMQPPPAGSSPLAVPMSPFYRRGFRMRPTDGRTRFTSRGYECAALSARQDTEPQTPRVTRGPGRSGRRLQAQQTVQNADRVAFGDSFRVNSGPGGLTGAMSCPTEIRPASHVSIVGTFPTVFKSGEQGV